MEQEMTCGWQTGTAMAGPSTCGKPAKAKADTRATDNGLVCGVHARSARSQPRTTVTDLPGPDVRPGQVWRDNDPRSDPRHVRVVMVDETHATVMLVDGAGRHWGKERRSRIRLDRFRPTSTGYRRVSDAPVGTPTHT